MIHYASYNISENMSEVLNHISDNACGFYFLVQNADTLWDNHPQLLLRLIRMHLLIKQLSTSQLNFWFLFKKIKTMYV